jgi:hypothetical protein
MLATIFELSLIVWFALYCVYKVVIKLLLGVLILIFVITSLFFAISSIIILASLISTCFFILGIFPAGLMLIPSYLCFNIACELYKGW